MLLFFEPECLLLTCQGSLIIADAVSQLDNLIVFDIESPYAGLICLIDLTSFEESLLQNVILMLKGLLLPAKLLVRS